MDEIESMLTLLANVGTLAAAQSTKVAAAKTPAAADEHRLLQQIVREQAAMASTLTSFRDRFGGADTGGSDGPGSEATLSWALPAGSSQSPLQAGPLPPAAVAAADKSVQVGEAAKALEAALQAFENVVPKRGVVGRIFRGAKSGAPSRADELEPLVVQFTESGLALRVAVGIACSPSTYRPPQTCLEVVNVLRAGYAHAVYVDGDAGMGKTALLNCLKELYSQEEQDDDSDLEEGLLSSSGEHRQSQLTRLNAAYPDGVHTFTFGGGPGPEADRIDFQLKQATELCRMLAPPASAVPIHNTLEEIGERLNECASGRRFLVLIDGVELSDVAAVQMIVRALCTGEGQGCACVVAVEGRVKTLEVDPEVSSSKVQLGTADVGPVAVSMLAGYAYDRGEKVQLNADHQEVGQDIVNACNGHPFALRLLASVLKEHTSGNPVTWLQVLSRFQSLLEHGPLHEHHHALPLCAIAVAAEHLSEDGRKLLPLLRLFQQGAKVPGGAVDAAWRYFHPSNPHCAEHMLDLGLLSVVEHQLYEYDWMPDTFSFHRLVGSYLEETFPAVPPLPTLKPSNPLARLRGAQMDTNSVAQTAEGRVVAVVALHGALEPKAQACALLNEVRVPSDASPSRWWDAASSVINPAIVSAVVSAAGGPEPTEEARLLLISAALKHTWPALDAQLPGMLRDQTTVLAGMAYILGSFGRHVSGQLWTVDCEEALLELGTALEPTLVSAALAEELGRQLAFAGKRDAQMRMLARQAAIEESALGPGDPKTLDTMNKLGRMLAGRGKLRSALKYHRKVLDAHMEALGPQDPTTRSAMQVVGVELYALGRKEEALQIQKEALAATVASCGELHKSTGDDLNNVGVTLHALGRLEDALDYKQRALKVRKAVHGERSLEVASTLNNVGSTLHEMKRHEEALELKQKALAIRRELLGEGHGDTADSLQHVSSTLYALGKTDQALVMIQRAYEVRRAVYGAQHPITLATIPQWKLLMRVRHAQQASDPSHTNAPPVAVS